jgi:hypothetical protein
MRIHEIDANLYKKKLPTELDILEKALADLEDDLLQARNQERNLRHAEADNDLIQAAQDHVYDLVNKRKSLQDQISQKMLTEPMPQARSYMEQIEKECSGILTLNRKLRLCLLSGMRDRGAAFAGHTTVGRKPSDSDTTLSKQFDDHLLQMGFQALRSNSIFVTTDNYQAENYGTLYMIFPKDNKFDYTYTNRKDLILDTDEQDNLISLDAFVAAYMPQSQNIADAMRTGREIYISGQYIALLAARFGVWARERWGIDYLQQPENLISF